MPRFAAHEISRVVVGRAFKVKSPEALEARWREIQADPESAALARTFEARFQEQQDNSENPLVLFERLFGYLLPNLAPDRTEAGSHKHQPQVGHKHPKGFKFRA